MCESDVNIVREVSEVTCSKTLKINPFGCFQNIMGYITCILLDFIKLHNEHLISRKYMGQMESFLGWTGGKCGFMVQW